MAGLSTVPVLPNPLRHENPPNRNTYITQIDPWVTYILRTTIESNVRYESQLHGPIGVFLESIFRRRRRFMNIAQATLREVVDPDDDFANISFGSTGGEHQSRRAPGPEKGKLLPDFLTVKVVPHHPDQPRDYRIITVIELKREEDDRIGAELQMTNYMRRINRICSPDDSFKGFLVSYDRVAVYSYSGPRSDNRRIDMVDEYSIFDAGDPWTRDLADIAIRHWN